MECSSPAQTGKHEGECGVHGKIAVSEFTQLPLDVFLATDFILDDDRGHLHIGSAQRNAVDLGIGKPAKNSNSYQMYVNMQIYQRAVTLVTCIEKKELYAIDLQTLFNLPWVCVQVR